MDTPGVIFTAAYALCTGFLIGHNWCWKRVADSVKIVQQLGRMADGIAFRSRFMAPDMRSTATAEFVRSNGKIYKISMMRPEDDWGNPTSEKEGV